MTKCLCYRDRGKQQKEGEERELGISFPTQTYALVITVTISFDKSK